MDYLVIDDAAKLAEFMAVTHALESRAVRIGGNVGAVNSLMEEFLADAVDPAAQVNDIRFRLPEDCNAVYALINYTSAATGMPRCFSLVSSAGQLKGRMTW